MNSIVSRAAVAGCLAGAMLAMPGGLFAGPPQAPEPADRPAARSDPNSLVAHAQLVEKARAGRIDVYFAGDSITRRWGATDYPELLAHWTTSFFGWNAANFGWGADRTENILWRLENGELDGVNPKVIVVLAGTNNVGAEPGGEAKVADVTRGVRAILETCRRRAPGATIILTAIFPRNDNIAVMPEINRINANIARLADGRGVRYLDVNGTLADESGRLFPGMTIDGLHPTLKGYQAWADGLRPILTELLGPPAAADHAPPPTGDPSATKRTTKIATEQIPHLRQQGSATQLVVDGSPFLIRGGEVGNSAATNPAYLRPFWSKFAGLNMNTVLVPVYWDLLEPEEGRFDFSTVDQVIGQAREHSMRLVLLWFGSWKNSMSCYAPAWVKRDPQRFPRATDLDGTPQEILSPFSPANRDADARAFAALSRHLREADGAHHTVVMVQVENEVGMIPTARDHSAAANRVFATAVPGELLNHLAARQEQLTPELRATWIGAGSTQGGTWTEVFGGGPAGEEIFMAWHFGRYVEAVAAAGKQEYPLPMFVNAALIRPGHQPGQYPSAGPLPHLADVWRAAAPSIDFLAPDIYFQNFSEWVRRYRRPGNPVFVPEATRGPEASVNGLYAVGAHDAIGFSPFGIESISDSAANSLAASFSLLAQLEPLVLRLQGKDAMAGLLSEGPKQRQPQQVRLGGYLLKATFERAAPPAPADGAAVPAGSGAQPLTPSGGLVLATAPGEFIVAGTGLTMTFAATERGKRAGILSAEEGRFIEGRWEHARWLGGDETHQGRHVRLEPGRFSMQRVKLYRY